MSSHRRRAAFRAKKSVIFPAYAGSSISRSLLRQSLEPRHERIEQVPGVVVFRVLEQLFGLLDLAQGGRPA